MTTPVAWNRQEDQTGGPVQALGGGQRPDDAGAGGHFVMLHHAPEPGPSGDPQSDQGAPPVGPPGSPPGEDDGTGPGAVSANDAAVSAAEEAQDAEGAGVPGGTGQTAAEAADAADAADAAANAPPGPTGNVGEDAYGRGGLVRGSGKEHEILAQAGEFVVTKAAVRKYGVPFMAALNAGRVRVNRHDRYVEHHLVQNYAANGPQREAVKPRRNHAILRGA